MTDDISIKFIKLVDSLTTPQFWAWASGWLDIDSIRDTYNEWDDNSKLEEMKNIKEMLKNKKFKELK